MYYLLNLIKNFWILILLWLILLVFDTGLLVNYVLFMYNIVVTPLIFFYLKSLFFNTSFLFCFFLYFLISLYSIQIPGYKYIKFFGFDIKILKKKYWENIKNLTNKNWERFILSIILFYFLFFFYIYIYKEFWIFTIITTYCIIYIYSKKLIKKWILGVYSKKNKLFFFVILIFITFKISTIEFCNEILNSPIYFDKIGFNVASEKIDEYSKSTNAEMNALFNGEDLKNIVKKRFEDKAIIYNIFWWEKLKVIYFFDINYNFSNLIYDIYKLLTQTLFSNIKEQINSIYNFIIEFKNIRNYNIYPIKNKIEQIILINNEKEDIGLEIDKINIIDNNLELEDGGFYSRDYLVGNKFFTFNRDNYYKLNYLLQNLYILDLYMLNYTDFDDKLKVDWIQHIIEIRDEAKNIYVYDSVSSSWSDYSIYINKYKELLDENQLFWIFDWELKLPLLLKNTYEYNLELSEDDDYPINYWSGNNIPFLLNVKKNDILNDLNYKEFEEGDYITWTSSGLFSDWNNRCDYYLNTDIQDWNYNLIDIFVKKYYGDKLSTEDNELFESEFIGLQKPSVYDRKEIESWWLQKQSGKDT